MNYGLLWVIVAIILGPLALEEPGQAQDSQVTQIMGHYGPKQAIINAFLRIPNWGPMQYYTIPYCTTLEKTILN